MVTSWEVPHSNPKKIIVVLSCQAGTRHRNGRFMWESFACALSNLYTSRNITMLSHTSSSGEAEISVRSPRKIIIFIIYKNIFWIKVSNFLFFLSFKNRSTDVNPTHFNAVLLCPFCLYIGKLSLSIGQRGMVTCTA